jgi:hypothetical protein
MTTGSMLALAGMQRSDPDPHDTTSMTIEVDPYGRIMWPFRSEDHRTTERAQADRSRYPVDRFGIHPFAQYGAPIRRKSCMPVALARNVALPYPFRYRLSSNRGETLDGIGIYIHFRPMKRVSSIRTF